LKTYSIRNSPSFVVFRRLSPSFGFLNGPIVNTCLVLHESAISVPTRYTLQLTCVLFRYRSLAFVYSASDRENLSALRRPRLFTRIDLLHSYRTGPR